MPNTEFSESLFDTSPLSAQEEEAFAWEPSQEDREWLHQQDLLALMGE